MIYLLIAGLALLFVIDRFLPSLLQKLLYPAPAISVGSAPAGLVEKQFVLEDGAKIVGWLNPPKDDSTAIILLLHGNAENLETMKMGGVLHNLSQMGTGYLAIDYPEYGRSTGSSNEESCTRAARKAFDWLKARYPNNPLVIMGWSLGAGIGFQTADGVGDALSGFIGISPWFTLGDVALEHYPGWVVGRWLKEDYNSAKSLKSLSCPILLIHGEEDTIIPLSHGERLSRFLPDQTTWVPLENTGHNDIFSHSQTWEAIRSFLKQF